MDFLNDIFPDAQVHPPESFEDKSLDALQNWGEGAASPEVVKKVEQKTPRKTILKRKTKVRPWDNIMQEVQKAPRKVIIKRNLRPLNNLTQEKAPRKIILKRKVRPQDGYDYWGCLKKPQQKKAPPRTQKMESKETQTEGDKVAQLEELQKRLPPVTLNVFLQL